MNKLVEINYETIPAIGLCIGFEKGNAETETVVAKGPELLLLIPFIAFKIELCFMIKIKKEMTQLLTKNKRK